MKVRLTSELVRDQIMPALENLRKHTHFFSSFTNERLGQFCNHFKFVGFKEKQQITRRGEQVDMLAFIIRGTLQGLLDNHNKLDIKEGDIIGYMAALRMQGSEVQQIDYFAREDGYLAFIKLEDLRLLYKRESQFAYFLLKQLGLFTLDSISHQFSGQLYQNDSNFSVVETTSKKILHLLDNLGKREEEEVQKKKKQAVEEEKDFRYYWNQLEQRDKRIFVQCSSLLEIEQQQILIKSKQKSNGFYIVLEGELVEFEQGKAGRQYKSGEIIGLKQFLTGQSYSSNIFVRFKCLLIFVSSANFEDIVALSGISGCQILSMITRYEAQIIRNEFEKSCPDYKAKLSKQIEIRVDELKDELKTLPKKEQQTNSQLFSNYFEFNTNSMRSQQSKQQHNLDREVIAPLYLLDSYKEYVAKRGYQSNELKDRKDPMYQTGLSIFLRDKLSEQHARAQKQKEEARKARKNGKEIQPEENSEIYIDKQQEVIEEINNDYYAITDERDKYKELVYLLEEQIKQIKEDQKTQKEDYQKIQAQMRKMEMHKELLALDLASQLLQPTDRTLKKKITLFDNYIQQAQDNKKFQKTVRVAEKMFVKGAGQTQIMSKSAYQY